MGGRTLVNREREGQAHGARRGAPASGRSTRAVMPALVLALLAAPVVLAATRPAPPTARPAPAPEAGTVAATVGPMNISLAELDQRTTQALADYRSRAGSDVPAELRPAVKRQMLERLVQRDLLVLEAARQRITASDGEAEAGPRKDPYFTEGGGVNEAKYLSVKSGNPV